LPDRLDPADDLGAEEIVLDRGISTLCSTAIARARSSIERASQRM
jgi:hypothetical protein